MHLLIDYYTFTKSLIMTLKNEISEKLIKKELCV